MINILVMWTRTDPRYQRKKCCFLSSQSQQPFNVFILIYSKQKTHTYIFCFCLWRRLRITDWLHQLKKKTEQIKKFCKHKVQGDFLCGSENMSDSLQEFKKLNFKKHMFVNRMWAKADFNKKALNGERPCTKWFLKENIKKDLNKIHLNLSSAGLESIFLIEGFPGNWNSCKNN